MNNSLYDIFEMATRSTTSETVAQPRRWDLNLNPPIHACVRISKLDRKRAVRRRGYLAHTGRIIFGAATARPFEDPNRTLQTRRKSVKRDNSTSRSTTEIFADQNSDFCRPERQCMPLCSGVTSSTDSPAAFEFPGEFFRAF